MPEGGPVRVPQKMLPSENKYAFTSLHSVLFSLNTTPSILLLKKNTAVSHTFTFFKILNRLFFNLNVTCKCFFFFKGLLQCFCAFSTNSHEWKNVCLSSGNLSIQLNQKFPILETLFGQRSHQRPSCLLLLLFKSSNRSVVMQR